MKNSQTKCSQQISIKSNAGKPAINTLEYNQELCINCGMCSIVCPHGVFASGVKKATLVRQNKCMECGACMVNCPVGAIQVESGVGCAYAMMKSALFRKKVVTCDG